MDNLGFIKFYATPNYSSHPFLRRVISKVPFSDLEPQQSWENALKDSTIPGIVVQLDVGGHRYTTLYHTLMVSAYFERILESPGLWTDADNLKVDRDGELFGYILDYLRTTNVNSLPSDPSILVRLKEEVQFYKIPFMGSTIEQKMKLLNNPQEESRERIYKVFYAEEYERLKRTKGFMNDNGELISEILLEYEEITTLNVQEPYWVCPRGIHVHTAPTKCGRICKREFDLDYHGWHFLQVEKILLATRD